MNANEHRTTPRIQTRLPGRVASTQRVTENHEAVISNMSMRGAFIETPSTFNIGDRIRFEMLFPRKNMAACVVGIVRWCNASSPQGIGVEVVSVC